MYVDPNAPVFRQFPLAAGSGVHADEADSALSDLAGRLQAGTFRTLQEDASITLDEVEVRSNPPSEEDEDDAVVTFQALMPIAMLVTGQWGPDAAHVFDAIEVRPNPPDVPRDYAPFFDRLRRCREALVDLRATALQRYDVHLQDALNELRANAPGRMSAAQKKSLRAQEQALRGQRRPWLTETDKMVRGLDFVLAQEGERRQSVLDRPVSEGGLPLGLRWGVLAAKGNKKLPFASYSELPMATCPGAGNCRVPMDEKQRSALRARGMAWCYSFKAFRYPMAFARLFLNTLAAYADREFAIIRGHGPEAPRARGRGDIGAFLADRVSAALRGRGAESEPMYGRVWAQYIKGLTLRATRAARRGRGERPPRIAFLRLFVDGDINQPDNVIEYMQACREMGRDGRDIDASRERHVEVYGYSKCWSAFADVDAYYRRTGTAWPENYTVNLSSGSVYAGKGGAGSKAAAIRSTMEALPISRGYFEAIPLDAFLANLEEATHERKLRLPVVGTVPFSFKEGRIEDFARLNRVRTIEDLDALYAREWSGRVDALPTLHLRVATRPEADALRRMRLRSNLVIEPEVAHTERTKSIEQQVRHFAFREYLSRLLRDDRSFGALVRDELSRDANFKDEADYLEAMRKRGLRKADRELVKGGTHNASFTDKMLLDKALSLALHEVLWSYGLGGSCPLVCGNCSDTADIKDPNGVHRCASKTAFRGRTIHIGLH